MGSISGEFLPSGLRLSMLGHQCWFAIEPVATWVSFNTGHLAEGVASSDMVEVAPVSSLLMVLLFCSCG